MEGMGVSLFAGVYGGTRVLVTGDSGFKGSWLALWLKELGAQVHGMSLAPDSDMPSHWELLGGEGDTWLDIRDAAAVAKRVREVEPDVVFHLAAQPLVRYSYANPLETWTTNVIGTANVLDACRTVPSVRAAVVITTDKCYENLEWDWGYRENDRLGGHDPYSASKAAAELVVASYRKAYFGAEGSPLIASARAGNVIGGGDWSVDRLIPDVARAVAAKRPLLIRSPRATRPWQHVLEALAGYLCLGQRLLQEDRAFAQAWNFGPDEAGNRTVQEVLEGLHAKWSDVQWQIDQAEHPHEAGRLHLDSSMARSRLGWKPVWTFEQGLHATADWYRSYFANGQVVSRQQLGEYVRLARERGAIWSAA